jgi:protein-S-isoprenylcysteine O-methyltransferase Ste14
MANRGGLADSLRRVLLLVVLAAAAVARVQQGNSRHRTLAILAAVPSVLGFAVALRCIWDFGWTGRGTPVPVAPPQRLVVVGFYRYVRNPMYAGFAAGWIGLWVVLGHANPAAIAAVAGIALVIHLFVVFYEEPTLRRKFGRDYEEYCRNVRRWWPRVRAWDKPQ